MDILDEAFSQTINAGVRELHGRLHPFSSAPVCDECTVLVSQISEAMELPGLWADHQEITRAFENRWTPGQLAWAREHPELVGNPYKEEP